MQASRVKVSISLPADLVHQIERTARVEARPRSRVFEAWLRTAWQSKAARELESATIAYYESMTEAEQREDVSVAASLSAAARRVRIDDSTSAPAGTRHRRKR